MSTRERGADPEGLHGRVESGQGLPSSREREPRVNHAGTRTHAHAHTHSAAEIEAAAFGTKGARGKGGRRTEEEFSPCLCP